MGFLLAGIFLLAIIMAYHVGYVVAYSKGVNDATEAHLKKIADSKRRERHQLEIQSSRFN